MRQELLQSVLSIPSKSRDESRVVSFLIDYCQSRNYSVRRDKLGNVFVRKGRLHDRGEAFPLLMAHTDTVHQIEPKTIRNSNGILRAYSERGQQIGIGGDCLAGVFICLELLEAFPKVKAFFPIGEEIGCVGSTYAAKNEKRFFRNVGWAMEFDSPGSDTMSYSNSAIRNFNDDGEFILRALPSLDRYGITSWQRHPFTDVKSLRLNFDFPCLNLAAGYFRMHTDQEYVVVDDVQKSIQLGWDLIMAMGRRRYVDMNKSDAYGQTALRAVVGCRFPDSPKLAAV